MCTRLYPDIIVAAEINNHVHAVRTPAPSVCVSIDDCLSHQDIYKQFGICNVFVGYGDQEWNKRDYEAYLHTFPTYFHPVENGYEVDLDALSEGVSRDKFARQICNKLFTQGTYSPKVLKALGLLVSE